MESKKAWTDDPKSAAYFILTELGISLGMDDKLTKLEGIIEPLVKHSRMKNKDLSLVSYPKQKDGWLVPTGIFTACWETLGCPKDYFELEEIKNKVNVCLMKPREENP